MRRQLFPRLQIYGKLVDDLPKSNTDEIKDIGEVEPREKARAGSEESGGDARESEGFESAGEFSKSVFLGWSIDDAEPLASHDVAAMENPKAMEDVARMLRKRLRRAGCGSAGGEADARGWGKQPTSSRPTPKRVSCGYPAGGRGGGRKKQRVVSVEPTMRAVPVSAA